MKKIFCTLLLVGFVMSTQQISAQDSSKVSDTDKQSVTKSKKKTVAKKTNNKELSNVRTSSSITTGKEVPKGTYNTTSLNVSNIDKPIKKDNVIHDPKAKTKEEEN